jgi:hypothetical protein
MAVLPSARDEMIQWFEDRIAEWGTHSAELGIDMEQLTELTTLISNARTVRDDAVAARIASKDATVSYYNGSDALRTYGSNIIKIIKARADADPDLYAVASIPPPAAPTPAGAPEQPTDITVTLQPGGGLRISWKGTISQAAYFSVYRRSEGESNFTLLDSPKDKFYDDTSIPSGANTVTYYIQARRDDFRVNSNHVQVSFGAGGATALALAA